MNLPWRIALYVVLALSSVFFAQRFFADLSQDMERAAARYDSLDADTDSGPSREAPTNAAVASAETDPSVEGGTNLAAGAASNTPSTAAPAPPAAAPRASSTRKGLYGALALLSVLALGLMVGREVSAYLGHRVQREIYGEASEPVGDAEYDEAERIWANGDHLEAVRLLREFLNKKPHKIHAAFRIAEIYEKDLGNNLAAALEYEEILKHKFARERWGWAAIHLVNLYNRMDQTNPADALLRRIVDDYGDTEAAAKARQRLGLAEDAATSEAPAPEPAAEAEAPPEEGGFRLPPGFRPK